MVRWPQMPHKWPQMFQLGSNGPSVQNVQESMGCIWFWHLHAIICIICLLRISFIKNEHVIQEYGSNMDTLYSQDPWTMEWLFPWSTWSAAELFRHCPTALPISARFFSASVANVIGRSGPSCLGPPLCWQAQHELHVRKYIARSHDIGNRWEYSMSHPL